MKADQPPAGREAGREYLVFSAGDACCAVAIGSVQEINRSMEVTRVFNAPTHVLGVMNLRGQIVTVIDLARRLGTSPEGESPASKNVVIRSRGEAIGLRVDEVDDIVTAGSGGLLPPPPHLPGEIGTCALGVITAGERLAIVLDVDGLTI